MTDALGVFAARSTIEDALALASMCEPRRTSLHVWREGRRVWRWGMRVDTAAVLGHLLSASLYGQLARPVDQ